MVKGMDGDEKRLKIKAKKESRTRLLWTSFRRTSELVGRGFVYGGHG
jgi:hypothetical protein